jgi:hypothetical protein
MNGLSALAVTLMMNIALPGLVAQPPATPGNVTPPPWRWQQDPVSKSDEHRVVGKVLSIDRERGLAKLATDEGVMDVRPPSQTLRAIRVGDTVSVPRAGAEQGSASPRE